MGAEVSFFEWCEDFSAARNAALDKARCDWVLVLDCDERLASGAAMAIRDAIRDPSHEAYLLPLRDAAFLEAEADRVVDGSAALREVIWLPRLFRKTPDLRWEGRVHENVSSWLERRGGSVGTVNAPIAHYGSVPEYRQAKGNSDRNFELLQAQINETPKDWFSRAYLLEECLVREHSDALFQAKLLESQVRSELLPKVARGERSQHGVVKALTAICVAFSKKAEFAAVCQIVEDASAAGVRHPNLDFLMGVALENRSHSDRGSDRALLDSALGAYMRVFSADERVWVDPLIHGVRTWNGLARMGTVLLCLGHSKDALEAFELASNYECELHSEIALGKAESLNALGRCHEALEVLLPLMEAAPESSDVAILAAEACDILGQNDASKDFWDLAIRSVRKNLKGLHRLQRLNARFAA